MKALKDKRSSLRSLWRGSLVILSILALAFAVGCGNSNSGGGTEPPVECPPCDRPHGPFEDCPICDGDPNYNPADPPAPKLVWMEVATQPSGNIQWEGAPVNLTGMVVNAVFQDASGNRTNSVSVPIDQFIVHPPVVTVSNPGDYNPANGYIATDPDNPQLNSQYIIRHLSNLNLSAPIQLGLIREIDRNMADPIIRSTITGVTTNIATGIVGQLSGTVLEDVGIQNFSNTAVTFNYKPIDLRPVAVSPNGVDYVSVGIGWPAAFRNNYGEGPMSSQYRIQLSEDYLDDTQYWRGFQPETAGSTVIGGTVHFSVAEYPVRFVVAPTSIARVRGITAANLDSRTWPDWYQYIAPETRATTSMTAEQAWTRLIFSDQGTNVGLRINVHYDLTAAGGPREIGWTDIQQYYQKYGPNRVPMVYVEPLNTNLSADDIENLTLKIFYFTSQNITINDPEQLSEISKIHPNVAMDVAPPIWIFDEEIGFRIPSTKEQTLRVSVFGVEPRISGTNPPPMFSELATQINETYEMVAFYTRRGEARRAVAIPGYVTTDTWSRERWRSGRDAIGQVNIENRSTSVENTEAELSFTFPNEAALNTTAAWHYNSAATVASGKQILFGPATGGTVGGTRNPANFAFGTARVNGLVGELPAPVIVMPAKNPSNQASGTISLVNLLVRQPTGGATPQNPAAIASNNTGAAAANATLGVSRPGLGVTVRQSETFWVDLTKANGSTATDAEYTAAASAPRLNNSSRFADGGIYSLFITLEIQGTGSNSNVFDTKFIPALNVDTTAVSLVKNQAAATPFPAVTIGLRETTTQGTTTGWNRDVDARVVVLETLGPLNGEANKVLKLRIDYPPTIHDPDLTMPIQPVRLQFQNVVSVSGASFTDMTFGSPSDAAYFASPTDALATLVGATTPRYSVSRVAWVVAGQGPVYIETGVDGLYTLYAQVDALDANWYFDIPELQRLVALGAGSAAIDVSFLNPTSYVGVTPIATIVTNGEWIDGVVVDEARGSRASSIILRIDFNGNFVFAP